MMINGFEPKIHLRGFKPCSLTLWPRPPTTSREKLVLRGFSFALFLVFTKLVLSYGKHLTFAFLLLVLAILYHHQLLDPSQTSPFNL